MGRFTLGLSSSDDELLEAVDFSREIWDRATFFPFTGALDKNCRSILADNCSVTRTFAKKTPDKYGCLTERDVT